MIARPILFSAPMVRALLDDSKIQTRRVVKLDRTLGIEAHADVHMWHDNGNGTWDGGCRADGGAAATVIRGLHSRYGVPGDRLWVRETWRTDTQPDGTNGIRFAADDAFIPIQPTREMADHWVDAYDNDKHGKDWRPSIFHKRWASRLLLEVTRIRVERLCDITEEDAKAEGVTLSKNPSHFYFGAAQQAPHRFEFATLWDSINGKRAPWMADPWTWVIDFKKLKTAPKET